MHEQTGIGNLSTGISTVFLRSRIEICVFYTSTERRNPLLRGTIVKRNMATKTIVAYLIVWLLLSLHMTRQKKSQHGSTQWRHDLARAGLGE